MRATPTLTLNVGSGTISTNYLGFEGFNMTGNSSSTEHFINDYTADAEL